ncbi:hypothetical protein FANTH_14910 [Fusarium anthophilum]|uniref:Phosphoglycerate mutase n=1 Tax=Fusarium anthophilum TaxID=48485 RepID=A0A8H4YFG8_9HYPO|nr:hypothetical protein FANTH_14910 [Fusarium anthophilum]
MAPAVFLIRHGQTEWSELGRFTGKTEKELTDTGKKEALALGHSLVGPQKLIDPSQLAHIFVSPRIRAKETFELVTGNFPEAREKASFDEDFREWDHGDYEGMTEQQIKDSRAEKGLDTSSEWSIWTGGCEGGESVKDMTTRVQGVIASIRKVQERYIGSEKDGNIMIVAHGTFLRCLWKVWANLSIDTPMGMQFETGSVGILTYKDNDMDKRVVSIGFKTPST